MAISRDDQVTFSESKKEDARKPVSPDKVAEQIGASVPLQKVAPFTLAFHYFYRRLFRTKLSKLSTERLRVTIEKISLEAADLENAIQEHKRAISLLESEMEKNSERKGISSDLKLRKDKLSATEDQLEELLTAKEFAGSVLILLHRKEFFQKNGIWKELNKISRKKLKSTSKDLIERTLDVRQMKEYLTEFNENEEMYKDIMKV